MNDVIKSFLVGLGFEVDEQSYAKFNKSIASATLKVTALYGSVKLAAGAVTYAISGMSESFEKLGYEYRIISPMINRTLYLRQELLKAYRAAGIDITRTIQSSVKLNYSLAKTKFALEALYKSVGSKFFGFLTKQSDIFRNNLYRNMPRIQAGLEKFVKIIFKALEATTVLGARVWSILTRIYDFFVKLDKQTDGWSTIILGVVAAWKLLNLEFLATPLGMLLAGLTALLALYDDFKTFQEGGQSLFNWKPFIPVIEAFNKAVDALLVSLSALFSVLQSIYNAFSALIHGNFAGFFDGIKQAAIGAIEYWMKFLDVAKSVFATGGALVDWAKGLLGNSSVPQISQNIQNNPVTQPARTPVGPSTITNNSASNQNVTQQTSINVNSSADANAVGRAVAGEQTRVNFDLIRNLRGATR